MAPSDSVPSQKSSYTSINASPHCEPAQRAIVIINFSEPDGGDAVSAQTAVVPVSAS